MSVPVRSTFRSTLVWAMVPAAILYAVALVWSASEGVSAKLVLKDLAQSCQAPLGQGFLSSVGYLLWMAAAAIALFAAFNRQIQGSAVYRQFAFCGGGFSLWLCLDDMFLVHDRYIGQSFLYITYAVFTGLLLFRFRGPLLRFGVDTFLVSVVLLSQTPLQTLQIPPRNTGGWYGLEHLSEQQSTSLHFPDAMGRHLQVWVHPQEVCNFWNC